jgi:hypothetical protein
MVHFSHHIFRSTRSLAVLALAATLAQAKVNIYDDTDLTGCSVQIDGYLFDLQGLSHTNS